MDKRFLAILGVIIVFFGGLIFLNTKDDTTTTNTTVRPTNHVTGKLDSKVTLVEYGDFQCPACQSYSSTTEALRTKYADTVKFQFRHLPLAQLHPNAIGGARAAEAADKQGRFWEMHDLLYAAANWSSWTTATDPNSRFESYARQLGMDTKRFMQDFKSSAVNDSINADIAAFSKTGAQKATPTYFLNGKQIPLSQLVDANGPSVDAFSKVIDAALAEAK